MLQTSSFCKFAAKYKILEPKMGQIHTALFTVSRRGSIYKKKLPGSDTYFFEKYISLGIQKRPNENIRCVA